MMDWRNVSGPALMLLLQAPESAGYFMIGYVFGWGFSIKIGTNAQVKQRMTTFYAAEITHHVAHRVPFRSSFLIG